MGSFPWEGIEMVWKTIFIVVFVLLSFIAVNANAEPFVTAEDTKVLAAPVIGAEKLSDLAEGTVVEVTHQAGEFWRVELAAGKPGYIEAANLRQVQTKGGPLVPLVVAAAAPVVKIVVTKVIAWFKDMLGVKEREIPPGTEMEVIERQGNGWVKVRTPDQQIGYIKQAPTIVYLMPVAYAPQPMAGIWNGAQPIPQTAMGLTLRVEVRKIDGTYVPPNGLLKLGEQYRIYVTPSTDCYIRITCDTPGKGHVCQYYPNKFEGTQTSALFSGHKTYNAEMLPPGINFEVKEPIGPKDILRIEATRAAPYNYVKAGDGCATQEAFRGGGFSTAGTVVNPTAQVILEYPITTTR
jgi:Bacterial SH3 domain